MASCCLVTKSCPTLCKPMDCSTLGFPVLHHLLEFAQIHIRWHGTPLQYCCLENPTDGRVWWAAIHGAAKSRTRLSDFTFTFMRQRRKWQPTPVFLPGESQGQWSLVGCRLWGRTESDTTEVTYSSSSMSIELVMLSNHLILCYPLLLLPSIFPRIRVFFQWVSSSHHMAKVLELQLQCMALMYG